MTPEHRRYGQNPEYADPDVCVECGLPWPCETAYEVKVAALAEAEQRAYELSNIAIDRERERDAALGREAALVEFIRTLHAQHDLGHKVGAWTSACMACAIYARAARGTATVSNERYIEGFGRPFATVMAVSTPTTEAGDALFGLYGTLPCVDGPPMAEFVAMVVKAEVEAREQERQRLIAEGWHRNLDECDTRSDPEDPGDGGERS